MTKDQRQSLRDAAFAALNATRLKHERFPGSGAWELQTSNSFRRIGTHGYGDGDVLCGTNNPHDRHPDLRAPPGVLDYIVAAQPAVVLELLDALDEAEGQIENLRDNVFTGEGV